MLAHRSMILMSVCLAVCLPDCARADWPTSPATNLPVAVVPYQNQLPAIAPDGFGGFVVAWEAWRDPETAANIYAQRITPTGHTQWETNGIPVTSLPGIEVHAQVVPTSDGVIVVWADDQAEIGYDIYAQRMDLFGNPEWDSRGIPLCTATGSQDSLLAISDGQGGAIVVWRDHRSYSTTKSDIYAQRIDAAGDALWQTDGVAVCSATGEQIGLRCAPDGHGGIVAVWEDWRNTPSTGSDIYAQRFDANGVATWTLNGISVCDHAQWQQAPALSETSDGGAVVSWLDYRGPQGIYVQRITGAGSLAWADGGIAVIYGNVPAVSVTTGEHETAFLSWTGGTGDILAQKLDSLGTSIWTQSGLSVCAASNVQELSTIIRDEGGGVIISWMDFRNATSEADIYAQKVLEDGTFVWAPDGVPVSTAPEWQVGTCMLPDGSGGAFFAWEDHRAGLFGPDQIYAQRVDSTGALATPTGVRDNTPGSDRVTMHSPYPNPVSGTVSVSLRLSMPGDVTLRVYDVRGQEVWARVDFMAAGENVFEVPGTDGAGHRLPQGVYFLAASAAGQTVTRKFTLVR